MGKSGGGEGGGGGGSMVREPLPSLKLNVLLPLVSSKTLPFWRLPLYRTTTFFPGLASFPSDLPIASLSS